MEIQAYINFRSLDNGKPYCFRHSVDLTLRDGVEFETTVDSYDMSPNCYACHALRMDADIEAKAEIFKEVNIDEYGNETEEES
jgi:hypothetical protein